MKNVVDYQFRDKSIRWYLHSTKIHFASGKVLKEHFFKNSFFRGFLRNFFLRPSCYRCQYANINRPADITLADFWGYQSQQKDGRDKDDDKGISMIMLNSEKGKNLFELARGDLVIWEREVAHAVLGNPALRSPFPTPLNRSDFWIDYKTLQFNQLLLKYMYSERLTEWWILRYKWWGRFYVLFRQGLRLIKKIIHKLLGEKQIA